MSKYIIAMYDEDDYPYMTFENYKEAAKFFNTSSRALQCNICRNQIKKYRGQIYKLYKINLDDNDIELPKCKNLHIGALLEVLGI